VVTAIKCAEIAAKRFSRETRLLIASIQTETIKVIEVLLKRLLMYPVADQTRMSSKKQGWENEYIQKSKSAVKSV
jgi:hypothetical protein